ncbi:MAG: sigma factor [Acinetobacter sp.]
MKDAVFSRGSSLVQHYDELVDYISLKVGSRKIASDAVQETYLRVLQRPEQFLNLMHPIAFLKKVSINIALDHLRKDKNYGRHFEALEHDEIDALATLWPADHSGLGVWAIKKVGAQDVWFGEWDKEGAAQGSKAAGTHTVFYVGEKGNAASTLPGRAQQLIPCAPSITMQRTALCRPVP